MDAKNNKLVNWQMRRGSSAHCGAENETRQKKSIGVLKTMQFQSLLRDKRWFEMMVDSLYLV